MASGGARSGAGRKPKVKVPDAMEGRMTPLEYMLSIINDPAADVQRRDAMAKAAAPYMHKTANSEKIGKKEATQEIAKQVHKGTSWDNLLQ